MDSVVLIIIAIAAFLLGIILGGLIMSKLYKKHCDFITQNAERYIDLYSTLFQWVRIHNKEKSLVDYCKKNNIKTVAIYGLSEIGYEVLYELEKTDIEVKYCIDRNADNIFSRVDVFRPDERLMEVDAVIVAVVHFYDEVKKDLKEKINCPIVSLEDVVWEA